MDLTEAECAAMAARPRPSLTSMKLVGMGKPRDSVTDWEKASKPSSKRSKDLQKAAAVR